jgi:DNA-binding transcriptional regulator LsrR (DeoR family)
MPKARKTPGKDLLLKVAKLRYERGLKNQVIATRLNIGTKKVAALLEESVKMLLAQQELLARTKHGETAQQHLEDALRARYPHLTKVKVVAAGKTRTEQDYDELILNWVLEAAKYFDELVDNGELRHQDGKLHVAMSGGEINLEFANTLPVRTRRDVHFYASAFLGRGPLNSFHVDPATNATIAWVRSGRLPGHCIYATVSPFELAFRRDLPLLERKQKLTKQLLDLAASEPIETVTSQLDKVTIAFAGIGQVVRAKGTLRTREPSASGLLDEAGISPLELAKDGAVGDIAYCFFDANGNDRKDWRFFLSAGHYSGHEGVEFYRNLVKNGKRVILMAGPFKIPAIHAALKGQLFNVWFTDEDTARNVLERR